MQMRLKLARVEMAPRPFLRMVEPRQQFAAVRTGPSQRIMFDPQIHALLLRVQLRPCDMPRRLQSQDRLKELRILHLQHPTLVRRLDPAIVPGKWPSVLAALPASVSLLALSARMRGMLTARRL